MQSVTEDKDKEENGNLENRKSKFLISSGIEEKPTITASSGWDILKNN